MCPHPILRELGNGHCVACELEHQFASRELIEPEPAPAPTWIPPPAKTTLDPARIRAAAMKVIPTLDDIEAERCRRSLAYFVRRAWPEMMPGIPLHWNWHLEEMCRHVQAMLEEWMKKQRDPLYVMKAQNLIINCPPRSLKSTIVSICAPAWMWLRWPSWKGLFLSANPKVAVRDARGCRSLIDCSWYQNLKTLLASRHEEGSKEREFFNWTMDTEHDADGNFANSSGGTRQAMGFTAIVVGLGGDAIFIDDPNDMKKVVSEPERARINDTWDLSLMNRVNDYDSSIRVMIMQRGHEDDLTGHWVATMNPKRLIHLIIPLEFDPELMIRSPFGYADPRTIAGEILHRARFSEETVLDLKKDPWRFAAQYNQNPAPQAGGMFNREWWNFCTLVRQDGLDPLPGCKVEFDHELYPKRPKGCDMKRPAKPIPFLDVLAISVDATFGSDVEGNSKVGLLVIGAKSVERFVIEDRTRQMTFPDTCDALRQLAKDFPTASLKIIEKKANGAAVMQTLEHEVGGIVPIENNENYAIRWNAMVPSVRAGNWFLLEHTPWVTPFVSEFAMAPKGANDDRIDAASTLQKHLEMGGYMWSDY